MKKKLIVGIMTAIMSIGLSMTSFAGTWKQDTAGWWYQNDNSTYKANEWFQDTDGSWYYLNPAGYTHTNCWQQINGAWYYFDAAGKMASNQWIGNYYLGSSGAMLTNTTTPDGYKVGSDGAWIQSTENTVNTGSTAGNGSGTMINENGVYILYSDPEADQYIDLEAKDWIGPAVDSELYQYSQEQAAKRTMSNEEARAYWAEKNAKNGH